MKIMTIKIEDIGDKSGRGYYARIEELKITVMADSIEELFDAIKSSIDLKKHSRAHPSK